ncbi:MAG: FliM/FliN family flagellar motor switch protein [Pseudomonadota bacterium]
MGEDGLLIVLDGTDGLRGAVKLDHSFVTALIEVQLIGHLRDKTPEARTFTHTDAAITQPLINEVLLLFDQTLAEEDIESGANGLRFGDMVEDARTLVLGLEAPDYELYRLNVDLGPGKRTGMMELYLPHRPPAPEETGSGGATALTQKLEKAAMSAPVTLNAALTRIRLQLSEVLNWTPDTTILIDPGVLGDGVLLGAREHEVARFKLGQLDGFRAVQLMSEAVPDEGDDGEPTTEDTPEVSQLPALPDMDSLETDTDDVSAFAGADLASPDLDETQPGLGGDEDWPALDGLDDVAGDLDEMLLDVPDTEPPAELLPESEGDDGDFAPLPMMMAEIDLDD